MARNIEIKAALSDIALIYERLRQTAAHGPEVLMQKDIFYRMIIYRWFAVFETLIRKPFALFIFAALAGIRRP
jgi:adenylate cyclase class IV